MRPVPMTKWGKDHWSTLAFIETLCVDHKGIATDSAKERMRCNPKRHPGLGYNRFGTERNWRPEWGTRLKGFFEENSNPKLRLKQHDDWDCVDDFEHAGVLETKGTGINPVFVLTKLGQALVAELRAFKSAGGNFYQFNPTSTVAIK